MRRTFIFLLAAGWLCMGCMVQAKADPPTWQDVAVENGLEYSHDLINVLDTTFQSEELRLMPPLLDLEVLCEDYPETTKHVQPYWQYAYTPQGKATFSLFLLPIMAIDTNLEMPRPVLAFKHRSQGKIKQQYRPPNFQRKRFLRRRSAEPENINARRLLC